MVRALERCWMAFDALHEARDGAFKQVDPSHRVGKRVSEAVGGVVAHGLAMLRAEVRMTQEAWPVAVDSVWPRRGVRGQRRAVRWNAAGSELRIGVRVWVRDN